MNTGHTGLMRNLNRLIINRLTEEQLRLISAQLIKSRQTDVNPVGHTHFREIMGFPDFTMGTALTD